MCLLTAGICLLSCLFSSQAAKDVVFVLDRSGSLDASDVADALEFIYNVTEWLTIGTNDTLISLVTYSNDVKEEFKLSSHPNKTELLSVIYGLRGMKSGGGTYTYDALGYVLSSSFTVSNGGRPNVSKAVVVMTDGASNDLAHTEQMADQLRSNLSAEVYSIGIGESIDKDELSAISSDPDSYYGLSVHDFVYLCNLLPALVPKLDSAANATLSEGCPVYTTTPDPTRTTTPTTTTTTPTTTSTTPTTTTTTPTTTTTTPTTTTSPTTTTTTPIITTMKITTEVAITAHLLPIPESNSSTTAIALGVAFGLLGLIASIILFLCLRKKCQSRKPEPSKEKQNYVVPQKTLASNGLPKPSSNREDMFTSMMMRQSTNVSILDMDMDMDI